MLTSKLRRRLPATRILALGLVAAGALLGARTLPQAQAKSPVGVTYKISGPAAATSGQTVSYTINVHNPDALTAATGIDLDLNGKNTAIFVGYTASAGVTCAPSAFAGYFGEECTLAALAPGASASLTLQVTLTDATMPTYIVGGAAAAAGYLVLVDDLKTTVSPAPPVENAPNYSAPGYEGHGGDHGPA